MHMAQSPVTSMVASSKHVSICALADGSHLAKVATRRRFPGPALSRAFPTPTGRSAASPLLFALWPVSSRSSLHSPIISSHSPSCPPPALSPLLAALCPPGGQWEERFEVAKGSYGLGLRALRAFKKHEPLMVYVEQVGPS